MSDVPSIPATQVADPKLRPIIDAVRQMLITRSSGRDTMDRWITWRDLVEAGIAQRYLNGQPLPVPDPNGEYQPPPEDDVETPDLGPPPAPTDLEAVGGLLAIYLSWSMPAYNNLGYYEIWRSLVNNQGSAVRVGTTVAQQYADFIGNTGTYYYWVRAVSKQDLPGQFNAFGGTAATVSQDPTAILDMLNGQITESQLYGALNDRISLIDADASVPGSVNARVADLAQEVSLLAAGTGEQFDYGVIFYFDTGTDDFSTNAGQLSQAGTWLTHKSASGTLDDPSLYSDTNLGVVGGVYPQVRMRLRKVGAPVWKGELFYTTTNDLVFGADKKVTEAEPTWTDGIATVTFDMDGEWLSDVVHQLRLDLADAITASDYYDIDWIAIGRPSPGASTAALLSEVQARTAADQALASAQTTLQTTVNGHTASLSTQQSTINGLSAQYTVKLDNNGFVAGFGLASEIVDGVPHSSFLVNVDRFAITQASVPKTITALTRSSTTGTASCTSHGYTIGRYVAIRNVAQAGWNGVWKITAVTAHTFSFTVPGTLTTPGSAISGKTMQVSAIVAPFIVDSGLTVINTALIKEASITSAMIGSLTADKITAGYISAAVGLGAAKIHGAEIYQGGTLTVNYDSQGVFTGFTVNNPTMRLAAGVAEFTVDAFRVRSAPGVTPVTPFEVFGGIVYLNIARIRDATITAAKIADATITSAKIALANITEALIANAAITTAKIADAAITTAKIANAQITNAKLANAVIDNAKIQDAAITNSKIADAQITNAKIVDAAVDTLKLAGQAVTFSTGNYAQGSTQGPVLISATLPAPTIVNGQNVPVSIAMSAIVTGNLVGPTTISLRANGVEIYSASFQVPTYTTLSGSGPTITTEPGQAPFSAIVRHTPSGSGSVTYEMRGSGTTTNRAMVITELKR